MVDDELERRIEQLERQLADFRRLLIAIAAVAQDAASLTADR